MYASVSVVLYGLRRLCVTLLRVSRCLALDKSFDAIVHDFTVRDRAHVSGAGELASIDAREPLYPSNLDCSTTSAVTR